MKKVALVILVTALLFAGIACGSSERKAPQPSSDDIKLFETMMTLHKAESSAFLDGEIIKVEPLDGRWDVLNIVVADRLSSMIKAEKDVWLRQNVQPIEGLGRSCLYPKEASSDRVLPQIQVTYENGEVMAVSGTDKMTYKVY